MNEIRAAWASGRASIGCWPGPMDQLTAERTGASGYDWVLLDMENSGLHWDRMIPLMQAVELGGSRAMVRVAHKDPHEVMRALDYGAIGVVVPMIETPEEAKRVADAMRYPPNGRRGNGQVRRLYASTAEADADVVCVVMIESELGWRNLDAITATPGVDAVMIGQVDLALSLGWPLIDGGVHIVRDERARDAVARVVEVARRHGRVGAAAIVGGSDQEVRALLAAGVGWLGYRYADPGAAARERTLLDGWRDAPGVPA